jgi:hypothetical protein
LKLVKYKIVLDNGLELDISSPESLGIKLNRIVDDYSDPSKKFGEFSYTVNLPKTKNNQKIFEFPDTKGRTRIFNGKQFGVTVICNNQILIKGILELRSFDTDSFNCQIVSSLKELVDDLKGKKLCDMTSLDTIDWDYEKTIVTHINSNKTYLNTSYQFPLAFYKTFFYSGNTTGTTEQEFCFIYNYDTTTGSNAHHKSGKNYLYQMHFPPSIYLYNILEAMFNDIGWGMNGTFFDSGDFRKIIVPFCGKTEQLSGAVISGSTTDSLNLNKLLPDIDCLEFLKSFVTVFNLYLNIDKDNRQITFETYKTLFNSYNTPYDITKKVDAKSIQVSAPNSDVKISFELKGNTLVGGHDKVFDLYSASYRLEKNPTYFVTPAKPIRREIASSTVTSGSYNELKVGYNSTAFGNLWNKVSGDNEVKLKFSATNYVTVALRNDKLITGMSSWNTGGANAGYYHYKPLFGISIPLLSEQTPYDDKGNVFAEESGTTYTEGNDPTNINYDGGGTLKMLYYYGNFAYNIGLTGVSFNSIYKDWVYMNIATGGTPTVPTYAKVRVPIASPYKLMTVAEKNNLLAHIKSNYLLSTLVPSSDGKSELCAEAQGLLQTFTSVGTTGDTHSATSYSLTMGDNESFNYDNLYSYFHKQKYDLLNNSSLLKATMFMDEYDWASMQIHTPIIYDKEKYQLVSIKNYDPVRQVAEINLIKRI